MSSAAIAFSLISVSWLAFICANPPSMTYRFVPPSGSSNRNWPTPSLTSSGARLFMMPICPSWAGMSTYVASVSITERSGVTSEKEKASAKGLLRFGRVL